MEVNMTGVSGVQMQNLDLETAIMAVQSNRANNLEAQLKAQLQDVAKRNEQIASLNQLLSDLRALRPSGSDPEKWANLGTTQAEGAAVYERIKAAGLTLPTGNDEVNACGTWSGDIYDAKQKTFDVWAEEIKGKIDSASNSQQMDMLRLQSLSNKRNEAFEIMTNFAKKMSDNRSSIAGNLR